MNIMNKRIEAFVIDVIVLMIVSSPFFLISVWLNNSMLWQTANTITARKMAREP